MRLLLNDKDVSLNPAVTRNEKRTFGDPFHKKSGPIVWTGYQWKTGDVKPNLT